MKGNKTMKELLNKYLELLNKSEKMRATCLASENDKARVQWETKIDFYSCFVYDLAAQSGDIVAYEVVTERYFGYDICYNKTIVF